MVLFLGGVSGIEDMKAMRRRRSKSHIEEVVNASNAEEVGMRYEVGGGVE